MENEKYYKAILYSKPDIRLEVIEIDENEAKGYLINEYSFVDGNLSGIFAVRETFDDFIDTQHINAIGKETEFGYMHDNFEYKYCEKIINTKFLEAVKFATTNDSVNDKEEFLYGVQWALKNF